LSQCIRSKGVCAREKSTCLLIRVPHNLGRSPSALGHGFYIAGTVPKSSCEQTQAL